MPHINPLLERNKHFATTTAREGASIAAKHKVYVITCLDPRTDPSAFLELKLGDAMVIRNAGGRFSPDVLTDLAYIGYLSKVVIPGGPGSRSPLSITTTAARISLPTRVSVAASPTSSVVTTPPSPRKPSSTPSRPSAWTSSCCAPAPSCRPRSLSRATSTTSTPA